MRSDSPFGINTHVSPKAIDAYADIGVRWHRVDVNWNEIEPQRGQRNWGQIDAVCDVASRRGLSLLASIAYTPTWASGGRDPAEAPLDSKLFAAFAADVASRYRGRIAAVSVWNEPDLPQFYRGSRDRYLSLIVAAHSAIRDAAPETLRCGPDLSTWSGTTKEWLTAVLRATDG